MYHTYSVNWTAQSFRGRNLLALWASIANTWQSFKRLSNHHQEKHVNLTYRLFLDWEMQSSGTHAATQQCQTKDTADTKQPGIHSPAFMQTKQRQGKKTSYRVKRKEGQ